jgi:hypothetical protein
MVMKKAIRNETSILLVAAAAFTGAAIPVLTGFLEPSQPPAVAAVQIADPREDRGPAREAEDRRGRPHPLPGATTRP